MSSEGLAVRVETADPAAARLAFGLVRSLGADAQIASFREPRFERRNRILVRVEGGHGLQLMHEIGVLSAALEPLAEPPRRVVARPCCRASYLRARSSPPAPCPARGPRGISRSGRTMRMPPRSSSDRP